jgi:uncharacterized membrane protein
MFGKSLVFYVVAGTIIAVVAFALGAGTVVAMLASLVGPPVLLLALRLIR